MRFDHGMRARVWTLSPIVGEHREHAQSMALFELDRIRKGLVMNVSDKGTQAHRLALKLKIDRALDTGK